MATERQAEANRRNAAKSTGPTTMAGKQRARANAYRHGFAAVLTAAARKEIDDHASKFAGDTTDPMVLQLARTAAHADFILARAKLMRIAWIQRTYALGARKDLSQEEYMSVMRAWIRSDGDAPPRLPEHTMPPPGPERLTEAIKRALPELAKLERYEARAAARRNRAFRELARCRERYG